MSIGETLLIFGGIPLTVIVLVAGLVYAAGARSAPRYRPGRPFAFTPVWYLAEASPEETVQQPEHPAPRKALSAPPAGTGTSVVPLHPGGARGSW